MSADVQTLWGDGLPRAQLDSGGHSSFLSPRAWGQTNPHGVVSLLQRSLSCLEGLAVAGWLLIPPLAPVHHGWGIMELSMNRILLWVTLKFPFLSLNGFQTSLSIRFGKRKRKPLSVSENLNT